MHLRRQVKKKNDQEVVEITEDGFVKDGHQGGTKKEVDTKATIEEKKQEDFNVLEVNMLSASPPYVNLASKQDTIKIKDVSDNTVQNINPLTEDDLKRIL